MAETRSLLLSMSLCGTLGLLLLGCSDSLPDTGPMMRPGPVDDGANPDVRCQPIAQTGSRSDATCALPFPSSYYLKTDTTTSTGFRINIPKTLLPRNSHGVDFNPDRLNLLDGFSPGSQIVADLGARVDPSQLAPVDGDPQPSLTASAPVQLIRYDNHQRVPVFAEVDANVPSDSDDTQVLIIRPLIRLEPGTRYVVALRDLKDVAGKAITVRPFRALADQSFAPTSRLATVQAHYTEIFTMLDGVGVPRQNLTLAWDFVTASDARLVSNLVHMRDLALARMATDNLGITVTKVTESMDPLVLRTIAATFTVPSFLLDGTDPSLGMKQDSNGQPLDTGNNYQANLLIVVPSCVKTATLPLRAVVYGHGLLGAADEIETSLHRNLANQICIIEMATNFIGLSEDDLTYLGASVLSQFDNLSVTSDRLQQAQINFAVLVRMARTKLKDLPSLTVEGTVGGHALLDGTKVYYLGASQGGIFGNTIVAISPDLDRGVLNVGGGNYSMMLPRSTDFSQFQGLITAAYPDPLAMQLLLSLSQSYWDFSDPMTFARHNLQDVLPGTDGKPMAAKHILLQESHNDCQVPNLATRTIARSMGLPQLKPVVEPVFGLTQVDGPVDSAYVQYDTLLQPAPSKTNVPNNIDNGAHGSLGKIPQVIQQMDDFMQGTGQVQNTCGMSCVFPITK